MPYIRDVPVQAGKRRSRLPAWLVDPNPPYLVNIGYALLACFVAAAAGLFGLWLLAIALIHHPHLPPSSKPIPLHDLIGVAQLVFASVAGAGALVALIVAYRRQRVAEADSAHDRIRVFNERFIAISAQLGDDNAAVRLAGVHAMAGLADDWQENRQTCVDVLCAYLRMAARAGAVKSARRGTAPHPRTDHRGQHQPATPGPGDHDRAACRKGQDQGADRPKPDCSVTADTDLAALARKTVEILGADVAASACGGPHRRDAGVCTAGATRRRQPLLVPGRARIDLERVSSTWSGTVTILRFSIRK